VSAQFKIAITGGGISGLTAAIFLCRSGHSVTVFERFAKPESIGAGILLQPTGLAVLQQLDLLKQIEARSSRVESLVGLSRSGKKIMDVHYRDLEPHLYGLGIHRANLFNCLYDAAIEAGAEIRLSADLAGHQTFDALVVANGQQSSLNNIPALGVKYKPYPWGALWAIVDLPNSLPANTLSQRYQRASKMIGMLPTGVHPETGNKCASFFWSIQAKDHADWKTAALSEWRDQVLRLWPELEQTVATFVDHRQLTFARYGDVTMRRFHAGNIVFIGDAAHAMSPQLGQGANLGLLDASVLNDCLVNNPVHEAFAEFTVRRRKHIRFAQLSSRWLTPLFQSNSITAAALRDLVFPMLNHFPLAYRQALRTVVGVKTGFLFDKPAVDIKVATQQEHD